MDKKMKFDLNPLFNIICNRKMFFGLVAVNVLIALSIIANKEGSILANVLVGAIVDIVIVLSMISVSPKFFRQNGKTLEFKGYIRRPKTTPFFVITRGIGEYMKVDYFVSDITNLEFHQNFIEKIFDVGHISFNGKAVLTANTEFDRMEKREEFVLYGIKHFSRFKSEFVV